jgi:predicted lysophospholipase L1 biosynthesis ABC-type transport system permease subunit
LFRHLAQGRRDGVSVDIFLIAAIVAVACISALRAISH